MSERHPQGQAADQTTPGILVWLAPAGLSLLALAPLPYGVDTFVRIIVCGACAYLAWIEQERRGQSIWLFALLGAAVIVNPFVPMDLTPDAWTAVDVAVAVLLVAHLMAARRSAT